MKENTKRILLINKDINGEFSDLILENIYNIDDDVKKTNIEIFEVGNIDKAIEKLKSLAEKGHKVDIISVNGNGAGKVLDLREIKEIKGFVEQQSEALKPEKLFIYADDKAGYDGEFSFHSRDELIYFRRLLNKEYRKIQSSEYQFKDQELINHINKTFDLHLPEDKKQLKSTIANNGTFEIEEIYKGVCNKEYTEAQALKGVSKESIKPLGCRRLDYSKSPEAVERFYHSTEGLADNGYLAFTYEEVDELNSQGKLAVIVVSRYDPDDMKLLQKRSVPVTLKGGSDHIKSIFLYEGKVAIFNTKNDTMKIETQIENEEEKRYLVRSENKGEGKSAFRLGFGDPVSVGDFVFCQGHLPIIEDVIKLNHRTIANWADTLCANENGMKVKVSVNTAGQIREAIKHGAHGVDLVRTEHIRDKEKMETIKNVLKADNKEELSTALKVFKAEQQANFEEMFRAAKTKKDFSITIRMRLLDAPPEEFLKGKELADFQQRLGEGNLRGARFALKTPGLYAAQAEAIFDAAKNTKYNLKPEILIPLVYNSAELAQIKKEIDEVAERKGFKDKYRFGSMIETLGAVDDIRNIASKCDFINLGCNDLTEEITKLKKMDTEAIRQWLVNNHLSIKSASPFIELRKPIIEVMDKIVKAAKAINNNIEISVCGDQISANYNSIKACRDIGVDNISVAPTAAGIMQSRILAGKAVAMDLKEEKLVKPLESIGGSKHHRRA